MIKTQIAGKDNNDVAHLHKKNGDTGLRVHTSPVLETVPAGRPYLNPTFGSAMNQNVTFSGTPEIIHDGGDTSSWTGAAVAGVWDFAAAGVL